MEAVAEYRFKNAFIPFLFSGLGTGLFLCTLSGSWNIITFLMGFLIGSSIFAILFFTTDRFFSPVARKTSILLSVFLLSVYYMVVIYIISIFYILLFNITQFDQIIQNPGPYFYNQYIILGLLFGLIVSFLVNFYIALNTLLGKGVLFNMLIGKYHRPRTENRFFLSIDLKSSTTIAENIGSHKFLMLLNDFFYDISKPVVLTGGEIYKYMGDEALISWKEKKGRKNQNPLRCVFLFEQQLKNNNSKYQAKYNWMPEFRAALHFGEVITGEMGFVRKEITFLGDALNTTSRILEECKKRGKDLLISNKAWERMDNNGFHHQDLGTVLLRGKSQEINLFTAHQAQILKK